MSSILGCFAHGDVDVSGRLEQGLPELRYRGVEEIDAERTANGCLAVARFQWECQPALSGPAAVARSGELVAVADASLYYREDLLRKLGDGPTAGDPSGAAADLILRAYRTWGAECVDHLEGDYAFVVWNTTTGEVFAARDFTGARPLYWALGDDGLAVASGIEAVVRIAGVEPRLVDGVLRCHAAGFPSLTDETHVADVFSLAAGSWLAWQPGQTPTVHRWWTISAGTSTVSYEEAAEELRTLLVHAIRERAWPGVNAVWLSGGWDSTAVLGAGVRTGVGEWRATSVTYPPDDPGNEDACIRDVAQFCGAPVAWIDSESLPVLPGVDGSEGPTRPFTHAFAGWLEGLASRCGDDGARVSFSGYGGDQLFQSSDVFLADLLRRGRVGELVREWRHPRWRGEGGSFLRWMAKPVLPGPARTMVAKVRGGTKVTGHLDRAWAPWIVPDAEHEAALGIDGRLPDEDHASHELRWYLTDPYFPAIHAIVNEIALTSGTLLRSPLMDQRLVRFAAQRPREERSHRGETKRLLRRSMAGWLPETTLAARPHRTGTSGAFFQRQLRRDGRGRMASLFDDSRLARLGIVRADTFRRWWDWFDRGGSGPWDVALFATVVLEHWLQEHVSEHEPAGPVLAAAVP